MTAAVPRLWRDLPRLYNPVSDAIQKGIDVGFLPITTTDGMWVPKHRTIIVSDRFTDPVERRCALAHMMGHADAEQSLIGKMHQRGLSRDVHLEQSVRRHVSRRLVPIDLLEPALRSSRYAEDIAHALGVTVRVLADRLRNLTATERTHLRRLTLGLRWPQNTDIAPFACGIDTPIHKRTGRRRFTATRATKIKPGITPN